MSCWRIDHRAGLSIDFSHGIVPVTHFAITPWSEIGRYAKLQTYKVDHTFMLPTWPCVAAPLEVHITLYPNNMSLIGEHQSWQDTALPLQVQWCVQVLKCKCLMGWVLQDVYMCCRWHNCLCWWTVPACVYLLCLLRCILDVVIRGNLHQNMEPHFQLRIFKIHPEVPHQCPVDEQIYLGGCTQFVQMADELQTNNTLVVESTADLCVTWWELQQFETVLQHLY